MSVLCSVVLCSVVLCWWEVVNTERRVSLEMGTYFFKICRWFDLGLMWSLSCLMVLNVDGRGSPTQLVRSFLDHVAV